MFTSRTIVVVAAVCAVVLAPAPALAQGNETILENLSIFFGPDGSKQPQDLGINANMGIRFAGNVGFSVAPSLNLGVQAGVACNISDAAVHVLDQIEGTSSRNQVYFTTGVFSRTGHRLNLGLAYDALLEHYYDDFTLGQLRGQVGYDVTRASEVGVWFTKSVKGDDGSMGGTPVRLDPISQANGFFRYRWANHAQTAVWLGMAAGHDDVVWVLPANPRDDHVIVYGAELHMPLSERFAITGAANLVTPTATGTVDAFLGVAFYPARSAMRQDRNAYAPIADVANNPTFSVNMHR